MHDVVDGGRFAGEEDLPMVFTFIRQSNTECPPLRFTISSISKYIVFFEKYCYLSIIAENC